MLVTSKVTPIHNYSKYLPKLIRNPYYIFYIVKYNVKKFYKLPLCNFVELFHDPISLKVNVAQKKDSIHCSNEKSFRKQGLDPIKMKL
jgi:hypothetical protein